MNKIRKGDTVIINTGKDKGKQGIVLKIVEQQLQDVLTLTK